MSFLLDHWKEFSILGAISIPLIGILSSTSKAVEWTKPFGYYTQARLFIVSKSSASTQLTSTETNGNTLADLLAEFPLKYLDKESWWKWCIPKGSKLKDFILATTEATTEKDCDLDWWNLNSHKLKNSESISYLLKLMLKFFKLQNQLNLIFLFYSDKTNNQQQITQSSGEDNKDWASKIKEKCKVSVNSYKDSFLKNLFISSIPISKNCLITPVKVDMTLSLEGAGEQVAQAQNSDTYSFENLKKGTIAGEIHYSLTDYWGNLHNFSFENAKQSPASFKVMNSGSYKFRTNNTPTKQENGDLDLDKLFEKYQKRELRLEDFNLQQVRK